MTEWISILTEEIGEAAMKANHFHFPGPRQSGHDEQAMLRHELVQSAAVCVAIVEQLDNGQALVTTDNPMAEQKMNI